MSEDHQLNNMLGKKNLPSNESVDSFTPGQHYSLLKVTNSLKRLESFEKATGKYRLPADIKPCILNLLSKRGPIQTLENWKVPCIIACELKRIGQTSDQVQRRLENWGKATPSEIRSGIRTAFNKNYEFGMPHTRTTGYLCLPESI